eukprot:TRINITY_DN7761_c0_g1_i1.p2 TRINITY_DN7761_c0_g1~~TRINITY_DN7761_c0_g1_i1.p2  ORF type:complete len:270 (-),score=19.83 TRINITY_DN7761_c0_g1_i1:555-1364(-)
MDVKLTILLLIAVVVTFTTIAFFVKRKDDEVFYQAWETVSVSFEKPLPDCKNNQGSNILIDLGANCGNSFQALKKQYGPFNQSYLWELNPLLIPALKNLAKQNENVTLIPYGAWNKEEEIKLDIIGRQMPQCDQVESSWDGTSFVETKLTDKTNKRYNKSVTAKTKAFVKWYQQTVCFQDKVVLKIDIEKAEYTVLSHLISAGLLCHPQTLLLEFHNLGNLPNTTQQLKQYESVQNYQLRQQCFTSGFISTLELLLDFCENQPKLGQWL